MTRTVIESKSKTVVIGFDEPFCVIGERINPTGRKKLAAELEPSNPALLEAQDNHRSVLHRLVVLSNGTPEVRNRQRKGL